MGPQLGYYDPEIVIEADLHGPGHQRAGRAHPGRQPVRADRAHARLRVEPHDGDERQHRHVPRAALRPGGGRAPTTTSTRASASPMRTFDAGTLQNASTGDQPKRCATTSPSTARCRAPSWSRASRTRSPSDRSTYGEDAFGIAALRDMTRRQGRDRRRLLQGRQPVRLHLQLGLRQPQARRVLLLRASCRSGPRARTSCCRRSAPAGTTGRASCRDASTRTTSDPGTAWSSTGTTSPRPGWQARRRQPLLRLGAPGRGLLPLPAGRRRSRTSSRS